MHRREVCLAATFGKPKHPECRDDRRRSSSEKTISLPPTRRPVAMARRRDERDAVDEAAAVVAHQRHPPPAENRDVRASLTPRLLNLGCSMHVHEPALRLLASTDP